MTSTEIAIKLPWCHYCQMNPQIPGFPVCYECDEKNKQRILTRNYIPTGIFAYDWTPKPGIIIPPKDRAH
jgi:hypothetical protein